jgi:uncharacterized membrane protein YbhN (UPF0104 family)
MTCGARPRTGAPAASHPEAARRGDTGTDPVPAVTGRVPRPASGRTRVWAWVLAAGVVAVAAARLPGAASDARAMLAHRGGLPLAWLAVAASAQTVSLAGSAAAQRQLLTAGGARLPWRTLFGVVLASTGLGRVMPAGPVTGGAWQTREYRRRGTGAALGMWAVLAGGFTSMMVILALLLTGAVVAGTSALPLLACAAAVLATAAAGVITAPRRARALSRYLSRHHHRSPIVARLAEAVAGVSGQRTGSGWAVGVLACTAMGLLADAGLLTACFGLAGLPVPWRGLLFAYAAGQLGGRLVPLPGGLGGMEGGVLGALTLTGTPPTAAAAAVIVYRVAGYWAVGAAGIAVAAALGRRRWPTPRAWPWRVRHRVVGTVVPWAATEGSTPQVHLRVTPCQGPIQNVPNEK